MKYLYIQLKKRSIFWFYPKPIFKKKKLLEVGWNTHGKSLILVHLQIFRNEIEQQQQCSVLMSYLYQYKNLQKDKMVLYWSVHFLDV